MALAAATHNIQFGVCPEIWRWSILHRHFAGTNFTPEPPQKLVIFAHETANTLSAHVVNMWATENQRKPAAQTVLTHFGAKMN